MKNEELKSLIDAGRYDEAFDALAQPLHERLYARQTFELLDELTPLERAVITLDYVNTQVAQGGFIQFVQNGYVPLLVPLIEALQALNTSADLVQTLDDVLKVYVLNREILDKETSVAEFAKLYKDFVEFEVLESRFNEAVPETVKSLLSLSVAA